MSKCNENYICPVFQTTGKCDEQDALKVMEQFRDFYETKLQEIEVRGGGDCLEMKLKVQRRWIDDLTEQTQMMARIVKELEDEATCRVRMLEDKLRQTSKCAYENKEKETELCQELEEVKAKLKRMRPCVETNNICTDTEDHLAARKRERELEEEICCRQREVEELKCKCCELEAVLGTSQTRAENLQKADAKLCCKDEMKQLQQQNHYYEHVIECFKSEMVVMSEQLVHLQDILNLSNKSCREENSQLHNAVMELQKLSEKLQCDLIDTEKQMLIENQKNQLKDAKIDELQTIIGQKNADLTYHDEAINEMRAKLDKALMENHELETTIVTLNTTIMQLQCCMHNQEVEKSRKKGKSLAMRRSSSETRCDHEKRTKRVEFDDYESMKHAQKELERIKEKNKEKIKTLKRYNEDLKDKLAKSEVTLKRMSEQINNYKEEILQLTQKDCCREHELVQSKQIILELRQTLIELNESLAESELQQLAMAEEYHKTKTPDSRSQEDLYLSCRCEIALYKKLAENFKESLIATKRQLAEVEACNKSLCEELKLKETKLNESQKKSAKKDKETCQCIDELKEKLKESQTEEKRLTEFIETLKMEVQKKLDSRREKFVINCCDCNDMTATQEEIDSLKIEIKNMIQNQVALNNENDKLLKQVTSLQNHVSCLEEKNRHVKQKYEKLQAMYENLKEKHKVLVKEKENFIQTIRNLEAELAEAKCNRDDLCAESRNVVNNVKVWLDEQRKINEKVMKKQQCYCNTIAKLKQENESLIAGRPIAVPTRQRTQYERNYRRAPNEYRNVWNCETQESDSIESPRNSPDSCPCSMEEWYSPNYRDDDETTDNEDAFLQTLEAITQEMRCTNKKWKNRCQENTVSKDNK